MTTVATKPWRRHLEVRAGEILGIAAVAGNGQDELVEAISGFVARRRVVRRRPGCDGCVAARLQAVGLALVPGIVIGSDSS